MALLFQVIVTVVYWSVLHRYFVGHDYGFLINANLRTQHSVPLGLLFVDFCLNNLTYDMRLLWTELFVIFWYGIINLILTKIYGEPIYAPMSWDSVLSVCIAVGMLPISALFAVMLNYMS